MRTDFQTILSRIPVSVRTRWPCGYGGDLTNRKAYDGGFPLHLEKLRRTDCVKKQQNKMIKRKRRNKKCSPVSHFFNQQFVPWGGTGRGNAYG